MTILTEFSDFCHMNFIISYGYYWTAPRLSAVSNQVPAVDSHLSVTCPQLPLNSISYTLLLSQYGSFPDEKSLNKEKSTTDQLRKALSLFVHSIVIYPDNKVFIRHTIFGMVPVARTMSKPVSAPLTGLEPATCGLEDRRSVH